MYDLTSTKKNCKKFCAMSHIMSDTSGHSGHPKYSSGWVGPPKIWPGSGRATQKPWPAGQISGRGLARPSPSAYVFGYKFGFSFSIA